MSSFDKNLTKNTPSTNTEILKSEIKIYQNLVNERVSQIESLEKIDFETILDQITRAFRESQRQDTLNSKVDRLIDILEKLEEFGVSEVDLGKDVVYEYLSYLETRDDRLLLIKPRFVRLLMTAPVDQVNEFLDSKNIGSFAITLFVLDEENRYSLILFVRSNTSFYHYDLTKQNYQAAEQLMFRLRSYLGITRMVQVECIAGGVRSSVFLIENILKIMNNYDRVDEGDSFVFEVLNIPPESDRLICNAARKYIDVKYDQIMEMSNVE